MEVALLSDLWAALGGAGSRAQHVVFSGAGALPSVFPVTALAAASVGAAGLAVAELVELHGGARPQVRVDRRLASLWFGTSLRPQGWSVPPPWDPIAGDYRAADGWIRLHTNAPHHRAAALSVLGAEEQKEAVARAVGTWAADDLEAAVVAAGGCAAAMRSLEAWRAHPQGAAVGAEPLFAWQAGEAGGTAEARFRPERPLSGVRVLDLTRVLAGPVATRFLAGYGATVLRIDPPGWEEPGVVPEVTAGKSCARLDLTDPARKAQLCGLIRQADVLVHGYRPGALEGLGLGADARRALRPGLVEVSLDAYGWSGPWAGRRGFDSLVQMSAGIAEAGMRGLGRDRPTPLPVQALDHATGYLMAAAAIRGLCTRLRTGRGSAARTSLARTAAVLAAHPADPAAAPIAPETAADLDAAVETTSWGPALRLRAPLQVAGAPMRFNTGARALGSAPAQWARD
ncbi:CoA transferase [Roseixanthobacter liquoris]|uniref:CoA transferase n=1 Tax=Roseixanthobacter liquoris TaxID=3119921 RepID=UPI003726BBC3